MAFRKTFDLAAKVGEYTDREGKKKGRYQNVGSVMQGDDGSSFIMLARWFNPAGVPDLSGKGGDSVAISMFAPKEADQRSAPRGKADDFESDIPF